MTFPCRQWRNAAQVIRGWAFALWLVLVRPEAARAEDVVACKYQDYQESGGRIAVRVQSALVEKSLGARSLLKLQGTIDTITGATPNGRPATTPDGPVPLSRMEEERKAWTAELGRQFGDHNLTVGYAVSREGDYISRGWSLGSKSDFNRKNTTLMLGVAGSDDEVFVHFQVPWMKKRTRDVIAGVSQLLDAETAVTFNVSYSQSEGYLSDPYKLVQRRVEIIPGLFLLRTFAENRPNERSRWTGWAGLNRAVPRLNGALDLGARFTTDDFGLTTQTVGLEWFQKLGRRVVLRPMFRYFRQSAADFYHVTLDGTSILPTSIPSGLFPYYSADYRLSRLQSRSWGLKAVVNLTDDLQVDAAWERFEMSGRDGETSRQAYPSADIATVGLRLGF